MDKLSHLAFEPRSHYARIALVTIALITITTLPGCTVKPIDVSRLPTTPTSTPLPQKYFDAQGKLNTTDILGQRRASSQTELSPTQEKHVPYSKEDIQTRIGEWERPFPIEVKRKPYPGKHYGYIGAVDIPLPEGTPLTSISNGIVIQVETKDEWDSAKDKPETRGGISLTIMTFDENGRPVIIRYSHMQSINNTIEVGQKINSGQSIGNSGHSGNASRLLPKYPYDANQVHIGIRPLDEELNDEFDNGFVQQVLNGSSIPNLPYTTIRGGTQYDPHPFIYTLLTDPSQAELSVIYRQ